MFKTKLIDMTMKDAVKLVAALYVLHSFDREIGLRMNVRHGNKIRKLQEKSVKDL